MFLLTSSIKGCFSFFDPRSISDFIYNIKIELKNLLENFSIKIYPLKWRCAQLSWSWSKIENELTVKWPNQLSVSLLSELEKFTVNFSPL